MAIDGVKIIDSDQGYDIYNEVVGRYRDGDHVSNIIKDILDAEKDYCQITVTPYFGMNIIVLSVQMKII